MSVSAILNLWRK